MRDLESTPKTGTELFNMIRDRYFWELNDQSASDLHLMKKKQKEDELHGHAPCRRGTVPHRQYTDQYLNRDQ